MGYQRYGENSLATPSFRLSGVFRARIAKGSLCERPSDAKLVNRKRLPEARVSVGLGLSDIVKLPLFR